MKKLTLQEVQTKIDKCHNGKIKIIDGFQSVKKKAHIKCFVCGNDYFTTPYSLYTGHNCPYCVGNRKLNPNEYRKRVKQNIGIEYEVIGDYVTSNSKVLFKHNACGKTFEMTPHAFDAGQRCPYERYSNSAKSNGISKSEVDRRLKVNTDNQYKIISGFTYASKPCKIKHLKCNQIFTASPDRIYGMQSGCPFCKSSKGELAVRMFLKTHNFDFKEQFRIADCKNKRPLPFDFAVFDNNKLITLIEYQGIQHYEPKFGQENFDMGHQRDLIKADYCRLNNINLITIPYKRTNSYLQLEKYVFDFLEINFSTPRPNQAS